MRALTKKQQLDNKLKSIKGFFIQHFSILGGTNFLIHHGTDENVEGGSRATDIRQAASQCSQQIFTSSVVS